MALIRDESGADRVTTSLSGAIISTVNQAEVQTKLVAAGLDEKLAWWHVAEAGCEAVPFDEEQARIAGGLVRLTRPLGLSLGDRACLALALQRQATIYTTDRAWKSLPISIQIEVIR